MYMCILYSYVYCICISMFLFACYTYTSASNVTDPHPSQPLTATLPRLGARGMPELSLALLKSMRGLGKKNLHKGMPGQFEKELKRPHLGIFPTAKKS